MFLGGSKKLRKLRKDVEEIKNQVSKTEYQKITEPLNKKITRLENENFELKDLLIKILRNMKGNNVRVFVNKSKFKADFYIEGVTQITDTNFEIVQIPIEEELKECICERLYKGGLII